MNDVGFPVARVLAGIDAAAVAGLDPVKVNMVVKRGVNDHCVTQMAEGFRGTGHILRFVEFMDVGTTNGWRMDDVVSAAEIVAAIDERWPLEPLEPNYSGEVASRYRYRDGGGEIGIIASVTQPFCGACTQGTAVSRRQALHLSVRRSGTRSARAVTRRRRRRRARRDGQGGVGPPRGPLFRAPPRAHPAAREGGDVLHRRLTENCR